ncbi:FAD-dependent urate hydroxylase HpxO [Arenivirga flava]|uniref:FAD-dependent urate hydroxylase n=1 Tax=Arenivirga flava TaxID=1930060 RepID=A0AA37UDF3_9MICO|nr:monooxygenase [Arenivirga flava]
MKIIIIGAGVGGASAAIALQRLGHEVVVYDRMRENRPVGAALSLWSNGVKVLNWLGLADEVAALGGRMERMGYRDGLTGEQLCDFSLEPVTARTGQRPYPVARAELQALLMERAGLDRIRLGRRAVAVADDGDRVTVTFEDGSSDTGDLLIGADGARSIVRDHVLRANGLEPVERRYSGYTNYNGIVPADPAIGPLDAWTTSVADGKRCAVMPIGGDRFYFFVDVPQPSGLPSPADPKAPLEDAFGDWNPGVRALLDAIDPAVSLNRVEIWDLDPFHTWTAGRVAILGDAAHNTTPDIGQGACSALEDVFALAIALSTNTNGVEDALRRYVRSRSERAGELVLRARARAHETHAFEPGVTEAWYASLRGTDGAAIIRGIVGNIEGSPIDLGVGAL